MPSSSAGSTVRLHLAAPHWQTERTLDTATTNAPWEEPARNSGMAATHAVGDARPSGPGKRWLRFDPPCSPPPTSTASDGRSNDVVPKPLAKKSSYLSQGLLAVSFLCFAFGAGLVAQSFYKQQDDLGRFGMVFVLAGQAGLVLGLAVQLCSDWQDSRRTTRVQIEQEDRSSAGASDGRRDSADSFCNRIAAGTAPQDLLSELGHKLDHLGKQLQDPALGEDYSRQSRDR